MWWLAYLSAHQAGMPALMAGVILRGFAVDVECLAIPELILRVLVPVRILVVMGFGHRLLENGIFCHPASRCFSLLRCGDLRSPIRFGHFNDAF